MRDLIAKRASTPTYVYNITDAQLSGVDIDKLKIGMTIKFGTGTSAEEPTVYILPENTLDDIFDITTSTSVLALSDPSYCTHAQKTNTFIVTVPLWRLSSSVISDAIFQVYLFGENKYTESTVRDVDGVPTTTMSTVRYHNIIIDEGAFTLSESLVPPLVGDPKRAESYKVYR